MPGPPPADPARARRLGNPGKRRLPPPPALPDPLAPGLPPSPLLPASRARSRAGAPAVPIPPVPRGLAAAGRAAWRRLWRVGHAWLSWDADLALLTRLCEGYDERATLQAEIAASGRTTTGSQGQLVSHPAVTQLRALEALLTRWEALCGFTPADRSRLGLSEVQRVSQLEAFLGRERATPARAVRAGDLAGALDDDALDVLLAQVEAPDAPDAPEDGE